MKVLGKCAFVAGTSIGLFGCGGSDSDSTSPTPAPTLAPTQAPVQYPKNVQTVWDNHFAAFAAFNESDIMKDYTDDSLVSLFNDECLGNTDGKQAAGYTTYKGKAKIQEMFTALFEQMGRDDTKIDTEKVGPDSGNAKVIDAAGPAGNVFLTWATKGLDTEEIHYATDTFSFKQVDGDYKIDKQNIVISQKDTGCKAESQTKPTKEHAECVAAPENCTKLEAGWANHFHAFGQQSAEDIMKDYNDKSIMQVYDFTGKKFTVYDTPAKIEKFFKDAWAGDGTTKLDVTGVPLEQLDEDYKSGFLVWQSNHIAHATDTFIFDDEGMIVRQNIVVRPDLPQRVQVEV